MLGTDHNYEVFNQKYRLFHSNMCTLRNAMCILQFVNCRLSGISVELVCETFIRWLQSFTVPSGHVLTPPVAVAGFIDPEFSPVTMNRCNLNEASCLLGLKLIYTIHQLRHIRNGRSFLPLQKVPDSC